ncbi:hypothetical protein AB0G86_45405, partial [Streptomyces scabiei]
WARPRGPSCGFRTTAGADELSLGSAAPATRGPDDCRATSVISAGPEPEAASPTVVLVPGINMNGIVHRHIAQALASQWPTVVLDVPGRPA